MSRANLANEGQGLVRVAIGRAAEGESPKDFAYGIAQLRDRREPFPIYYQFTEKNPAPPGLTEQAVAGWLRRVDSAPDSDGILWAVVDFTADAARAIAAGKFTHLSPVWGKAWSPTGQYLGLSLHDIFLSLDPNWNRSTAEAAPYELPPVKLSDADGGQDMPNGDVFNDLSKLDEFICGQIESLARSERIDYGEATRRYSRGNPAIMRLREQLYRRSACPDSPAAERMLLELEREIEGRIADAMKEHPELGYGAALRAVAASEHAHLFRTREQLRRFLNE